MKVIFLDIDGVLNSSRSCAAFGGFPFPGRKRERDWGKFDEVAIGLLRRIVKQTGASCVLSSSWRLGMSEGEMLDLANRLGVPLIGRTRSNAGREPRGAQIQDWLDEHQDVQCYVIVDDDSDVLEEQQEFFVKVQFADGLSFHNHLDATRILGGEAV